MKYLVVVSRPSSRTEYLLFGGKSNRLLFLVTSYHIATGADDHQIKIWDLRHRKELYTLPAHSNLISSVKFEPVHGRFLVSSSFDQTVKVCA